MNYKIIAVHQEYTNNKLTLLAALWQANEDGSVRASYCTLNPLHGYKYLKVDETVNFSLIQQVAGAGMNLPNDLKKKYFAGIKNWDN